MFRVSRREEAIKQRAIQLLLSGLVFDFPIDSLDFAYYFPLFCLHSYKDEY